MVSSVQTGVGEAAAARQAAQRQREAKRWSLFLSVFGAFAASGVLWVLIILAVGWVSNFTAGLFS